MIEGMMPRLGMLVSFLWVLTAGVSAAEDEEPLRSIAAIHAIAPGELDRGCQVRFEGIVTLSPGGQVVQQEDHGIYIATGADHTELVDARPGASGPARLAVGMLVEIEGRAIRGGWTPNVLPSRIRIMGEAPLPQPAPLDLARLYSGADSGADAASPGLIVDRVARHGELATIWARDPFLSAGGDTRAPRRSGRGALAAAFAAEHASLGGGGGREVGRRRSSWP